VFEAVAVVIAVVEAEVQEVTKTLLTTKLLEQIQVL
jgi:hypothetical protein